MNASISWDRCFALVDMVSFFASVEQLDFPELQRKPVAVTNGITDHRAATIVAASMEAKAFGVKTGMRLAEAKKRCPGLINRKSRMARYIEVSDVVMHAIFDVCDCQEVYSIDECFLDLKPILQLYEGPAQIAAKIRQAVYEASGGLHCSIGISEGKLTAKYAASLHKGRTNIIPAEVIAHLIGQAKIGEVCGIGKRLEAYLKALGIECCADLQHHPMDILARPFGNIGRRLYMTCLGHDPEPLRKCQPTRSMGHSKILPPGTQSFYAVYGVMCKLSEQLTARLRKHEKVAGCYNIGIRTSSGWIEERFVARPAHADSATLWAYAKRVVATWVGQPAFQVRLLATDLQSTDQQQTDLFESENPHAKNAPLNSLQDRINEKFPEQKLLRAPAITSERRR